MTAGSHGAEEITAEFLFVLCKENGKIVCTTVRCDWTSIGGELTFCMYVCTCMYVHTSETGKVACDTLTQYIQIFCVCACNG